MARNRLLASEYSVPDPPLALRLPLDVATERINDRISKGNLLKKATINDLRNFADVQRAFFTWNDYNCEMLRSMFTGPRLADEYSADAGEIVLFGDDPSVAERAVDLHEKIDRDLRRLESIRDRLELIPLSPEITLTELPPLPKKAALKSVFVVHGHEDAPRDAVARLLTDLHLDPIILFEQANQGKTIVEKLESHSNVGFAVVILTPDDVGGKKGGGVKSRARQNVVLELGYFMGLLGRKRVCALFKDDLELPSDIDGVVYVPFDTHGAWRYRLAKEMKAAGLPVDMNDAA